MVTYVHQHAHNQQKKTWTIDWDGRRTVERVYAIKEVLYGSIKGI